MLIADAQVRIRESGTPVSIHRQEKRQDGPQAAVIR